MIHPLFRLLVSEPQMLADHVEAYAELVTEEVGAAAARVKRRMILQALSLAGIALGVLFGAIALMLWAAVPELRVPWVLVVVPVMPLLAGIGCAFGAQAPAEETYGLQAIREQLAADAAMLRSVGAQT